MLSHPFVLILSETQSLFRATAMNVLMEHPNVIRYIEKLSYIHKIIGLTVLRYCGSIIGIYVFKLLTRMTTATPPYPSNLPHPSIPSMPSTLLIDKPIQLYTSIVCVMAMIILIAIFFK